MSKGYVVIDSDSDVVAVCMDIDRAKDKKPTKKQLEMFEGK